MDLLYGLPKTPVTVANSKERRFRSHDFQTLILMVAFSLSIILKFSLFSPLGKQAADAFVSAIRAVLERVRECARKQKIIPRNLLPEVPRQYFSKNSLASALVACSLAHEPFICTFNC